MARAHRHYLPGQIWHLTHRCHERRLLLQFIHDRQAWIGWLFELWLKGSGPSGQLKGRTE
ncbi:MAG: hypothetical protein LAO21_21125 [Acidobacteriia bacterium]|nr:hypothetical protein [Terriglobia bacterium]